MILVPCYLDKPESSYAQVRSFAEQKEDEEFQQTFYVIYKLDEIMPQLDVMNSACEKNTIKKPICNVQLKVIAIV